MTVKSSV